MSTARKILPKYFFEHQPTTAHEEFQDVHRKPISTALRQYKQDCGSNMGDGQILSELDNFVTGVGFSEADQSIIDRRYDGYKKLSDCPPKDQALERNPLGINRGAIWGFLGGSKGLSEISGLNSATCSVIRDFLIWQGYLTEEQLRNASEPLAIASSLAVACGALQGNTFPDYDASNGSYSYFFCGIDDEDAVLVKMQFWQDRPSVYRVAIARTSFDSAYPPDTVDQQGFEEVSSGHLPSWLFSYGGIRFGLTNLCLEQKNSTVFSLQQSEEDSIVLIFEMPNVGEMALSDKAQEYHPMELIPFRSYDKSKLFDDYKIIDLGGLRYLETVEIKKVDLEKKEELGHRLLEVMQADSRAGIFRGAKQQGDAYREALDLVNRGAPMNYTSDEGGWTALHYALAEGYRKIIHAAAERGSDDPDIDFLAVAISADGREIRPFQVLDSVDYGEHSEALRTILYKLAIEQGKKEGLTLNEVLLLPPHAPTRSYDDVSFDDDEPDTMDGP